MSFTEKQLHDIILEAGPHFTIEELRPDGKTNVYRGRDVTAFIQHQDARRHEHKVFDESGALVYHRDANGVLHVGNAKQWQDYARKKKLGQAALTGVGVFRSSLRGALRWISMGSR